MNVTLKKQKVIDSYAVLVAGGQGETQKFFDEVQKYLHSANLPNVSYEIVLVTTGRFGSQERDYLFVSHKSLSEFRMYISARDFGNYLDVTWVLTLEINILGRIISKILTRSAQGLTYAFLDLFDQQELDAYTVVVHETVVDTVKTLYAQLNQDVTKLNTRSKSGLAAW